MYKQFYKKFIQANPDVQHYAAHSHHYWPDVTFEATQQYWLDSARLVDDKWDYFFSEKIPSVQSLIAEVLHLSRPEQLVFAPNTHELIYRVLSCFDQKKSVSVLTTDSEFYSFDRQINRLAEVGQVNALTVDKIPTLEFNTFEDRFIQQIKAKKYDLIFFSQVFFNSGLAIESLQNIINSVESTETLIVIDGYHAFMALPTDLKLIEERVFYIGGSYKYAQGGEGCCFMHVPLNCQLRPSYTGWFASFAELAKKESQVKYSADGFRFAGSTMDFTALYRLEAVLKLFKNESINVSQIHDYVVNLQNNFLTALKKIQHPHLCEENLLVNNLKQHGHFLTFELGSTLLTQTLYADLKSKKIITDFRGSRLRFGFALYQDEYIDFKN